MGGVKLPGCEIELPEVVVKRPIKFLGSPGTQLVLKAGSIHIKSALNIKECTIILKIPADVPNSCRSLFKVYRNSKLELQDCHVKAEYCVGHPYYVAASENRVVISDDICVELGIESAATPESEAEDGQFEGAGSVSTKNAPGAALFTSCSFINFCTHVVAAKDCSVSIDKCGFFKCKSSALSVTNPVTLRVEGSTFEDCNDSGIEIKWTKDETKVDIKRLLKIEGNTVTESKGAGILILGDKIDSQPVKADVFIKSNKIQSSKQDGICIKHLSCDTIEMSHNTIFNTTSNGIGIYSSRAATFDLSHIISKENTFCGIYLQETACSIKNSECCNNGVSGIGIVGNPTFHKHIDENIAISDCNISCNKQSGVSLLDYHIGTVNITNCKLDENKDYGLFLSCNESPEKAAASQSTSVTTSGAGSIVPLPQSKVVLTQGQMRHNKKGGIYLSQQYTHIDSTLIKDNGEFAVYIPTKNGEKDLAFAATTLMKKCISGHIGGRWGRITIYPSNSMCGCTVCNIF